MIVHSMSYKLLKNRAKTKINILADNITYILALLGELSGKGLIKYAEGSRSMTCQALKK